MEPTEKKRKNPAPLALAVVGAMLGISNTCRRIACAVILVSMEIGDDPYAMTGGAILICIASIFSIIFGVLCMKHKIWAFFLLLSAAAILAGAIISNVNLITGLIGGILVLIGSIIGLAAKRNKE